MVAPVLTAQARRLKGGRVLVTGTARDAGGLRRLTVNGRRVVVKRNRFRIVVRTRATRLVVLARDSAGNSRGAASACAADADEPRF